MTPSADVLIERTYGFELPTACHSSRPATASNPGTACAAPSKRTSCPVLVPTKTPSGVSVRAVRICANDIRSRPEPSTSARRSRISQPSTSAVTGSVPIKSSAMSASTVEYAPVMPDAMKPRSYEVTDGMERAPARAMLRAVGMTDRDWDKAQIGVASSWNEVTPCNLPLDRLAKRAKDGVRDAGGFPIEFMTIAISDGISMGHEGMRGSLVSREIIADSVECVMHSERLDGMVTFAGCDKSLPGMLMAAARLNLPSVFLYGGSILPGHYKDQALDIVSVFEAVGACAAGTISENELGEIERRACPTEGSCAGMFTANTMASVAEALGMCLPGSASPAAVDRRRDDFAFESGRAVIELLATGIRPRQIMTKEAFENAIAVTMALGGSTNLVLHLLAIAYEAGVELELDDFNRVGAKAPHIADMKPHGKYHMVDLDKVGGVEMVMKELLAADLLHGDALTVTGKTLAENLADLDPNAPDGDVVHPLTAPIHTQGGLAILTGSLAPKGSVVKVAGIDQ